MKKREKMSISESEIEKMEELMRTPHLKADKEEEMKTGADKKTVGTHYKPSSDKHDTVENTIDSCSMIWCIAPQSMFLCCNTF